MLNRYQKSGRCLSAIASDDSDPKELGSMLRSVFSIWDKYCADNCSVFVCSPQGGDLGLMMLEVMREAGWHPRHILQWVKSAPTFSLGRLDYDYQHEPIIFTWKKTHKRNRGGQWQTTIWTADKPRSSSLHPTMKPVELPINAILNHTDKGDVVVDMFGGSGTTMLAAEHTGREAILCELSPDFCAVILERMITAHPDIDIHKESGSA
jgi:hypothetical protein